MSNSAKKEYLFEIRKRYYLAGKLEGKVFKYSDSWTLKVLPLKGTHMGTTAPFSLKHWVGYLSAGFYLN
jgi:MEMO1 family protein